ncbi:MAG: hypothetical protein ACOYBE_05395 [Blautia sp.]|jgi:S-adenosylhomocysteine hydrolase
MDMPVLNMVLDSAQEIQGFHGKDIVVLHVNHCMDNSFYFSEALKKVFYEVVFIGVPYNDKEVEKGYTFRYYYGKNKKGIFELYQGTKLFAITDHDFTEATELLLERAFKREILPLLKKGKKLVVIEDGGYHYPVFARLAKEHPFLLEHMLGSVEQTTSGTIKCIDNSRQNGYAYPCTSIARSNIKMHVESRFIGHRVVEELSQFLYEANTFLDFHNVLILGYGIVGRRVAMDLKDKRCQITVYDTDPFISKIATAEGFRTAAKLTPEHFPKSTIVIGNVGQASFTQEIFQAFLDAAADTIYLSSSSSQDKEFKLFLNMVTEKTPFPEGVILKEEIPENYYTIYRLSYRGRIKTVYLIAQGMPVNFYRTDVISLTYSIIDLIFSEMLSMGLTLCQNDVSLEHKLYLLGEADGFMPFISEESLIDLWFQKYDLSYGDNIQEILDSHPFSGYLREKLSRRV